jgi:uncharacterized protein (DUF2141 family)
VIKPLRLLAWACAVGLSACASAPPAAEAPRPPGAGRVEVTVTGFTNERGKALVALFLSARGWPGDQGLAFARAVVEIREGRAVAAFEGVPAGPFALSVFHDVDEDRVLDTGVFGIPSEDYGFSRGARNRFGPPGFEAARLDLAAGETMPVAVQVE